jgi:hypothetical protein
MKGSKGLVAFCLLGIAQVAAAYEYPLQFKPNPGYRGLVVAGYYFSGDIVVGNCSYFTVSGSGSGKGGGGRTPSKMYAQTCAWDLHGNLLTIVPGAPAVPKPVATKGSLIIYANDGFNYTGTDSKLPERGFVNSPGSHYTWLTPNYNAVLHQIVYTMTVALKSDGDVPVNISSLSVSALKGIATLKDTDCLGAIDVGKKCSVTLTYNPTQMTGSDGLASDTLRIDLTSDAGEAPDFIQNFTIILPEKEN